MSEKDQPGEEALFRVKIPHSGESLLCRKPKDVEPEQGQFVIAETRYGKDLGLFLGEVKAPEDREGREIYEIVKLADECYLKQKEDNREKEDEAYRICSEKIQEHHLEMKLVSTHYLLDEPKILFFFTAENRVDFRKLVKDLVSVFRTRIELRQIGVRDESRVLGGVGVCGRAFCCHGMTDHLCPVSIKMAKEQNLSLNSMKISGPCGRLLCCLAYENDFYQKEKRKWPSHGSRIESEDGSHRVLEVNVIGSTLTVTGEGGARITVPFSVLKWNESKRKWSFRLSQIIDV